MQDTLNFKGHFKIQAIDQNNNVIDEWVDDNMIMESARTTMSEIFANLQDSTFINKITLGTMGHVGNSILVPKGKDDGFVKERTRLFSETPAAQITIGQTLSIVRKNDVMYIDATDNDKKGYYRFLSTDVENYLVNNTVITDTNTWEFLGTTKPYTYSVGFTLPGTNATAGGTTATAITEDASGSGSTVKVQQSNTSVIFTIDFATAAGNGQNETTSVFTEAALYANSRIFAMKTFKAKVKDSTVLLRIVWTITF
jgi:hypothetical protein